MVNTKALRKRMIDFDITASELADRCGVSQTKISFILRNKMLLTLELAEKIQEILYIEDEDFAYYFLNHLD